MTTTRKTGGAVARGRGWIGSGALLCAALMAGCGGDGTACGPGTEEVAGVCVPALRCGPGTVPDGDRCRPQCAPGENWDGQACVAVTSCAPGTVAQGGSCVPLCGPDQSWNGKTCEDLPPCGPGTTRHPQTGTCVPDESACAPGTTLQNGVCVPTLECGPGTHDVSGACVPDGLPEADVLEAEIDGQAAEFPLPAAGAAIRLGGTVDVPEDKNGDGYADGDWDAFRFTAPAGTWLRLSATSDGATLPAFLLDFDLLDAEGRLVWRRAALQPNHRTCTREVYLARAGSYTLWVSDFNQVSAFLFGYDTVPVGGAPFRYLVTVENRGVPQPVALGLPSEERQDLGSGGLAFYSVPGQGTDRAVEITARPVAPDGLADAQVIGALTLVDSGGALRDEYVGRGTWESAALLVAAPAGQSRLLVRDFWVTLGDEARIDLIARTLIPQNCNGGCSDALVSREQSRLLAWTLASGDFFVAGTYYPDAELMIHQQLLDAAFAPLGQAQMVYPGQHGAVWAYAESAGPVYLWLRWGDAAPQGTFPIDARIHATPALTEGATANNLPVFDMPPGTVVPSGLAHFSGQGGKVVFFTGFHSQPASWGQPFESVLNRWFEQMGPVVDVTSWMFPDAYATPLFTYVPDNGHRLYLAYDQMGDASGSYGVTMNAYATKPLGRPAVGAPVQRTLQSPALANFYTFEAGRNQYLEITVEPVLLSDIQPRIWVMNFGAAVFDWIWYVWRASPDAPQLGLVVAETAPGPYASFTAGYISPYDGMSLLLVSDAGGAAGPADLFNVQISVPPPPANDACSAATPVSLAGGQAAVDGSHRSASSEVEATACTSYLSAGPDVFYRLTLAAGTRLAVTADSSESLLAIYLFRRCDDVAGSCVAGADGRNPATLSYTVPADGAGEYFLGVDAYQGGGAFHLELTVTAP